MASACINWKGEKIEDGESFIPDRADPCFTCNCQSGSATACQAVHCSPPPDCVLYESIKGECCEYNCIQPPDHESPSPPTSNNATIINILDTGLHPADAANLSLRLVASTVTTFLILALLMFMIHRLRQRRILIMMRRMQLAEDDDTVAYVSEFNSVDMGMTFPPYEDPPPPYTPPKPPDIEDFEAPPPYQEREEEANNNSSLVIGQIPSGCPPYSETQNETYPQPQQNSVNENMSGSHNNSSRHPGPGDDTVEELPQALTDVHLINETNTSNSSVQLDTSQTLSESGSQLSNVKNIKNSNGNSVSCELFASLDRNGQVQSSCGATNDKSNVKPEKEVSVKKRRNCPHVRKNKFRTKSCSYKDGYSQTLPLKSSKHGNSNELMRNSYHASTSNSEFQDELLELNWACIELNHIKEAQVTKLETQGNSKAVASKDVTNIPDNASNIQSLETSVSSHEEPAPMSCANDVVSEASKTAENSDVSDVSVCSETGEMKLLKDAAKVASPNKTKDVLNISNGSCGFDNLRDALKSDFSYPPVKSSVNSQTKVPKTKDKVKKEEPSYLGDKGASSPVSDSIANDVNSSGSSPSGTKPKVRRVIYCDSDELTILNTGIDQFSIQQESKSENKKDIKHDAYPDNCEKQIRNSNLTSEETKKTKDRNKMVSPKNSASKMYNGQFKRKSELFPDKVSNKPDVMSKSACTAAEYGFNVNNMEDSTKIKKLSDSQAERIKKERIKRKESPETFRRISMAHDDNNQYKQYGFIDMPNSIENVDNILREERTRAAALKGNNSRNDSREKRSHSQERKRSGSSSRNNSAERIRKRHSSFLSASHNNHESPSPKVMSKSRENSRGRRKHMSRNSGNFLMSPQEGGLKQEIKNLKTGGTDTFLLVANHVADVKNN